MHVASLTDEERESRKFDHLYAAVRHVRGDRSFIVVDPLDTTKPLLQRLYKGFKYSLISYSQSQEIRSLRPFGNELGNIFARQFSFDLGYIVRCREFYSRMDKLFCNGLLPTDDLVLPHSTFQLDTLQQTYLNYSARINFNCDYTELTEERKGIIQHDYIDDLTRKFES